MALNELAYSLHLPVIRKRTVMIKPANVLPLKGHLFVTFPVTQPCPCYPGRQTLHFLNKGSTYAQCSKTVLNSPLTSFICFISTVIALFFISLLFKHKVLFQGSTCHAFHHQLSSIILSKTI